MGTALEAVHLSKLNGNGSRLISVLIQIDYRVQYENNLIRLFTRIMRNSYLEMTNSFNSILDFVRFGVSQANSAGLFYGHGTENVWDEFLWLVQGSLSLPFEIDPVFLQARLTDDEKAWVCTQLEKRIQQRIPVPYLIQEAYFCGLSFYVDERVLIPRSPIAELIQQQFSPWMKASEVSRILDLCTGSGCIAIACCDAFEEARVDAVDLSSDALDVAEINRKRHGVEDQLTLIQSDCFKNVPSVRYDLIVSNPPYVSAEEMATLPEEYRHEPKLALEALNEGLSVVERILSAAQDYLTEHGILIVEVGNSADALAAAYPDVPFTWLDFEQGGEGVFLLTRENLREHFPRGLA